MTPSPRTFLPPPQVCGTTEEIARQRGARFEPKRESRWQHYALPACATSEVNDHFRREADVALAAEFLARLPHGRVFGSGNVLSPDGRVLARDVSPDFGKAFAEHWLLSYQRIPAPIFLSGTTAVVATTMGDGYAHWLLEELPRWLSFDFRESGHVIAHAKNSFTREARARLGFAGTWIEPLRSAHFTCENLLVPSLVGPPGFPTPEGVGLVRDFAAFPGVTPAEKSERIFLSREKSRRRRISNEAELWTQLEPLGFARLFLEDLEWSEQIALFRTAKVVVAPHGAGLANLMFCAPGTRVVEFFNRDYVDGLYWRLATLGGLDYRPVVAESREPLRHFFRPIAAISTRPSRKSCRLWLVDEHPDYRKDRSFRWAIYPRCLSPRCELSPHWVSKDLSDFKR